VDNPIHFSKSKGEDGHKIGDAKVPDHPTRQDVTLMLFNYKPLDTYASLSK